MKPTRLTSGSSPSVLAVLPSGPAPRPGAARPGGAPRTRPIVESVEIRGNQFLQTGDAALLRLHQAGRPLRRAAAARTTSAGCGTPGSSTTSRSTSRTGRRARSWSSAVQERKRIQIVDYRGQQGAHHHATSRTSSRRATPQLRIDTFYDLGKARRVEAIIREMLAEKGRPFATVKHDAKTMGGAGMQVSFIIDDGPKAKVKSIEFDGQRRLLRRQAARADEEDQALGLLEPVAGSGARRTYTEEKWLGEPPRRATGSALRGLLPEPRLRHRHASASRSSPTPTASPASSRRSR